MQTIASKPKPEKTVFSTAKDCLNITTKPFRVGVGKGFENFTTKVTGKAIPLALGCVAYWLFWGRQNNQSVFLPVTTAFKLIKKVSWQNKNEIAADSSLRKFDTGLKKGCNWVANKFGNGTDNLVLNKKTNRMSEAPNFEDKSIAIAFLLMANFLF